MQFNSFQSVFEFLVKVKFRFDTMCANFTCTRPVFLVNVMHPNIKVTSMDRSNKDMLHCPQGQ